MALKPFSVVGEALQFSTRRFETVMRVAALPLALLLIFNMAAAFGYLSVANERLITFKDVAAAGVSWAQATKLAGRAASAGLMASSVQAWSIYVASLVVNLVLVSAIMAPLIRYAGLGEKPARGVLRIAFGPDQLRFIAASALSLLLSALVVYAPIGAATFIIIGLISTAASTPYAHFPQADSLHTIDLISGREALSMRGGLWLYDYGYWGAATLLVAALLAVVLILHLRPRAEDRTAGIGALGRALGVIAGLALFFGGVASLTLLIMTSDNAPIPPQSFPLILFGAAAVAAAAFLNLRLYPYAGVAVCRKSMGLGGTLLVTRRFDVFRLGLAFALLGLLLFLMQALLVWLGGGAAYAVLGYLAAAVRSYVRLVSGGEGGDWVFPFFGWLWAVIGIVFTVLWTAFTYGVSAGLWGRLYRESAR